ncbi:MAG TPA: hypothetical protein VFS59_04145 [Gemmatimonadaceae bacterium]|nr:hypothetical protein [Gemmatimonadaceae bacterium]
MRHYTRRSRRVTASLAALALAAAAGCASDPVSPDEWLAEYTPPRPPAPPISQPAFVGFANFFRTIRVGDSTLTIGYSLNRLGRVWLFSVDPISCVDCDNHHEYATGDFTLTGGTIVLRLTLAAPADSSRAGPYEVAGTLSADMLRLAYPDSMQQLSPMFSSGDYLMTLNRDF